MSEANPPPITPRELSYHEALAGQQARETAAASGGDPAALRALVHASHDGSAGTPARLGRRTLAGLDLREDDLLVTLCFILYGQVFGDDPRRTLAQSHGQPSSQSQMQAIAALAYIFTQPDSAWDVLDRAADADTPADERSGWKRDFRRLSLEFAGGFGEHEIAILGQHLVALARRAQRGDGAEDDAGNALRPVAS